MSLSPARRVALAALGRIRRDGAYSGPTLNALLSEADLAPADVAFATRLVYGTVGYQGVLDAALDELVTGRVEPRVRDILRMAAFELLRGDTPAYAVIDQAVGAVRQLRQQAAGLANAVLRRCAELRDTFPWGDPATDRDALGRMAGHPRWIVDLLVDTYGVEAGGSAIASGSSPAPAYVRVDPFSAPADQTRTVLAEAGAVECPIDPDCFELTSLAEQRPTARSGFFSMDAAAQMAPAVVAPTPGSRVLDIGAGRGNKTISLQAIAMRSGGPAEIHALDNHPGKTAALERRLSEAGVPGVRVLTGDATALEQVAQGERYDTVLLDAPCTGLGTLRRYPEKRWRLTPADPARMAVLQGRLLASAASVVRSGGRVVYSTCSVAPVENAGVIDAFLRSEGGERFVVEPLGERVPAEWKHFIDTSGFFQSLPAAGGPDGHFVAVLRQSG